MPKHLLNTNPGGIIFHDPRDTKHESLLRSSAIKSVKVKLTDERDRALGLNGLHFQVGLLFRFVSLKRSDPLEDLRRLLTQPLNPPQKKNKRAQRKRALKRGKEKIKNAKQKALAAETKTSGDTSAKKPSLTS